MRLARSTILGSLMAVACTASPPRETVDAKRIREQETVDAYRIRELEARLEFENLQTKLRTKERDDRLQQCARQMGGSFDALRCSSGDRWEQLNRRLEGIRVGEVR